MEKETSVDDKIAYAMAGVPQEEGNAGEETPAEETTASETSQEEESNKAEVTTPEGEQNEQAQKTPEEQIEEKVPQREYRPTRAERRIKKLLEENKRLKESFARKELPWNEGEEGDEPAVLTEDQLDEIIEERLAARDELAAQRQMAQDWVNDYEQVVKTNPELNPKSPKYNKELDELLSDFLTDSDGNPRFSIKVSSALSRLRAALENAKKIGAQKASVKLVEQAERGAITSNESGEERSEEESWEELDELMRTDQQAYYERLKKGKHPKL